jgi:hypothetical protein
MNSTSFSKPKFTLLALALGAFAGNVSAVTDITFCDEINQPGAYRLTQDLNSGSKGSCLLIDTDNVILDLQGHTITGNDSSTSLGISVAGRRDYKIEIRNGTIRNFGTGVALGDVSAARVENLSVLANKVSGIEVGTGSIVASTIVRRTTGSGITAGPGSLVFDNIAISNKGTGISAGVGSVIRANSAIGNFVGIAVTCPAMVSDNSVVGNGSSADALANIVPNGAGCRTTNNAVGEAPRK